VYYILVVSCTSCPSLGCFSSDHRYLFPSTLFVRSAGRPHVPTTSLDADARRWILVPAGDHAGAGFDGDVHQGQTQARVAKSGVAGYAGDLFTRSETVPQVPQDHSACELALSGRYLSADVQARQPVHASL